MRKSIGLAVVAVVAMVAVTNAAPLLSENWDGGGDPLASWSSWQSGVATLAPTPTDPHGNSFKVTAGDVTRYSKGFDNTGVTELVLQWNFYLNSAATTTQRSFGGVAYQVDAGTAPGSNAAMARLGVNNNANFILHHFTSSLQTVDTGLAISAGWHSAEIRIDFLNDKIHWKVDSASGSANNASIGATAATTPNVVQLGYNYSLGAAGSGVDVYYDDIALTPEPATLALLGLGGLFLRRRLA